MKDAKCFLCSKPVDSLLEVEGERVCSMCSVVGFEWTMLVHIVKLKKEVNSLRDEIKELKREIRGVK